LGKSCEINQLYILNSQERDNGKIWKFFTYVDQRQSLFPIPDYLSGLYWASVEGELANSALHHFKNSIEDLTIINYNNGRINDKRATAEAEK
jgi:hypothetical protein